MSRYPVKGMVFTVRGESRYVVTSVQRDTVFYALQSSVQRGKADRFSMRVDYWQSMATVEDES